ncbi:hypothetical protein C8F04DRAFT_1186272 [Mycena alexandri]|uniref:Uncharacterized protein n=1 Tax=Mycena alexandri TaxID=1745969 RepID=A0AAD6SN84_9AGAR|nr:hypothetical protein C8F04DRAFT_1186272 [Mycena alexandri]
MFLSRRAEIDCIWPRVPHLFLLPCTISLRTLPPTTPIRNGKHSSSPRGLSEAEILPSSHGITAKAPRPKRADVKSTPAQLAATKRYREARRQEVKGTQLEEASKASARLNHARFRERNQAELAHRQRTRRAEAYVEKYGWDAWADHNDRLTFHAQKRAAAAQKQVDDDLAEAEEEAEWAARRIEQAQGASGLSCSAVDTGAGDDDD